MTDFVTTLIKNCLEEWDYFHNQTIDSNGAVVKRGMKETDEGYWQRVGKYWFEGTGRTLTGKNTDFPWSATFISFMIKKSGAGERFKYSELHSTYIRWATTNRLKNKKDNYFYAFDIAEYAPKVGDLVCYTREPGVSYYEQPDWYKSHSDIVIEVDSNSNEIKVIGGNVSNSVTLKHLKIDDRGILVDEHNKWFAVIENKL